MVAGGGMSEPVVAGPVASAPAPPARELSVRAETIVKRYGDQTVLGGVTLHVREAETVALIGPSGGGKSTLLRCINGLVPFDGGSIDVAGTRLGPCANEAESHRNAAPVRQHVGMVFQDFQLFPHLTALDNVALAPIVVRGEKRDHARQRAQALLEQVDLGSRAHAHPRELSGGQKQRVAIARALAMKPRVLLCDEITSALDPELRGEVLSIVERLRSDGLTIILVTHEIGFARRAADRVVVLMGGRVEEEGAARDVIERPESPRVARFLARARLTLVARFLARVLG